MNGRVRCVSDLLPLLLLAVSVQVGAQEQTAAVLKAHEVDFFYRSANVFLPCYQLQSNVATILRAVGARDDIQVQVTGCNAIVEPMEEPLDTWDDRSGRMQRPSDQWGASSGRFGSRRVDREQSAHVRIRLMMPVEVTPEVLAEINKDRSRRELVSRVTGNAAAMNDPIIFPAQRQQVTLSRRSIRLEPEHCELLEQMSTSVFRELDLRMVGGRPNCSRDGVSRIPPQVTVEALMPVIPRAPQVNPASDSESDAANIEGEAKISTGDTGDE